MAYVIVMCYIIYLDKEVTIIIRVETYRSIKIKEKITNSEDFARLSGKNM